MWERGRGQEYLWIESFGVHPDQIENMGDRQSNDPTGDSLCQVHQVRTLSCLPGAERLLAHHEQVRTQVPKYRVTPVQKGSKGGGADPR